MKRHIRFTAYYRVGLALRRSARRCLAAHPGELADEFTEIETGKHADRRQGARRLTGAVLVIAKLDRLSPILARTSRAAGACH